MNDYRDVLYDYLEELRVRNQDHLRVLNVLERGGQGWKLVREYINGIQTAIRMLEDKLERAGLPLNRP